MVGKAEPHGGEKVAKEAGKVCQNAPLQSVVKKTNLQVNVTKKEVIATNPLAMEATMGYCSQESDSLEDLAPLQRLKARFQWWKENAPAFLQHLILQGVELKFQGQHLKFREQKKSQEDINLALQVMQDYVEAKAAVQVPLPGT